MRAAAMLTTVAVITLSLSAGAVAQTWQQYRPPQYQPPTPDNRIFQMQQNQQPKPYGGFAAPQGPLLGQQQGYEQQQRQQQNNPFWR